MKTIMNLAIAIAILTFSSIAGYNMATPNNTHQCSWEDCVYEGQEMDQSQFTSNWGDEEGTDSFYVELTHFMHPEMTHEQCEDYVFSGVE